ncbi:MULTISPECIES: KinB sensor domain-containing domain [unclassified Pseudomonas]|uniref:KinB sensor domain-containing domain n=1 Tax=unclassified Pseudomonas TaxID=196821 RepID=UPI00129EA9CA|nr:MULTISPECIES: KinB sensor domain-containing domain [unclassified Pseudomonas]MDH4655769.1 HAMP domain-containing protein [Pseudomonas sp. BN606]MRK21626.1 HAMP domain-containing protein [Pseudomonas sp. JG-B]
MRLRTRLFLSISALITVALLGLLLGLVSVMQMASSQERLINQSFATIDISLRMRQQLGDQMVNLMGRDLDLPALQASQQKFLAALDEGLHSTTDEQTLAHFQRIAASYKIFLDVVRQPVSLRWSLLDDDDFSHSLDILRTSMVELQRHSLSVVGDAEGAARNRALLVASLLGLLGIAVLAVGLITAHGMARRFAEPIDALAKAADQVGRGDFKVTLPLSPVNEMSTLIRRFGLMAEALRMFKETNVEKLLAEQQRLKAVLDSIDDGLLILDRQGRIQHANPVAQRQLSWEEVVPGQLLSQALGRPELDELAQRVLRGETLDEAPEDLEVNADGEQRLLNWRLVPVALDAERLQGGVMVLRDVTEERAFERVRNEFVLRASHELRTPVTGMQMAFGLLNERLNFDPEGREADLLKTVDEEMQRLVRLINDLLDFSRYQSGVQVLEREPCDLEELLVALRQRYEPQASEHGIEIELELYPPLPRMSLDRLQIERVLDNLVGNAIRHSPNGGHIRLQARRHGERVLLSVADDGEGVPYSQQSRIFEPFVQVGHRKGGAGLGLAMCKEIVQLHGGRIGLYSRPGHGAQFYMTLPM